MMPITYVSLVCGSQDAHIEHIYFLMDQNYLIEITFIVALIALSNNNLCIGYKHVCLLQSTYQKTTIFVSVGILEHSPLQLRACASMPTFYEHLIGKCVLQMFTFTL